MRRRTLTLLSIAVVVALALTLLIASTALAGQKINYDVRDVGPELRAETPYDFTFTDKGPKK